MNEARGPGRYAGLTREQKRQQEAAIYGLGLPTRNTATHNSMDLSQFTSAEIEKLRSALLQHDSATKPKDFDLNNPPKEPYRYQAFPRLIYDHVARKHKPVHSEEELDAHLAKGWSKEPYPAEVEETELSAADQAEAAEIDARLKKKKKAE